MESLVPMANQALVVLGPAIALFGLWLVGSVLLHAVRSRRWTPTPATVTAIGGSRLAQLPWVSPDERTIVPIGPVDDVRWKIRYAFQDSTGRTRDGAARWHSDMPPAVGDRITVLVSPGLARSSFVDFNPVARVVGGVLTMTIGLVLLVNAVEGLRG